MPHVLIIATVALGGGDISFAANLLTALAERSYATPLTVSLAVCKQAAGSAVDALEWLLASTCNAACVPLVSVGAFTRLSASEARSSGWEVRVDVAMHAACDQRPADAGDGFRGPQDVHSIDGIICGPLRLFDSAAQAFSNLYRDCCGSAGSLPVSPCRAAASPPMITLREFGQARFCRTWPVCTPPLTEGVTHDDAHININALPGNFGSELTGCCAPIDGRGGYCSFAPGLLSSHTTVARPTATASVHVDVSAGLLPTEGGIFHIPSSVLLHSAPGGSAPTCGCNVALAPYLLAYYRTQTHSLQAGFMAAHVASSIALEFGSVECTCSCGVRGGGDRVTLFLLTEITASTLSSLTHGVSRLPQIASVSTQLDDGASIANPFYSFAVAPSPLAATGCHTGTHGSDVGDGASCDKDGVPVDAHHANACASQAFSLSSHIATLAVSMVDGRSLQILVRHVPALPQPHFRALLRGSRAAIVTGDGSLNEAICLGTPFWYSAEPHKGDVRDGLIHRLQAFGAANPTAAAAVAGWWAQLDAVSRPGKSILSSGSRSVVMDVSDWHSIAAAATLFTSFLLDLPDMRLEDNLHALLMNLGVT